MDRDKRGRINRVLFIAYILLVWIAFLFLHTHDLRVILIATVLLAAALAFAVPRLFGGIRSIRLPARESRWSAAAFLGALAATALVLGIWRWASWPGGFSPDSRDQLAQALTGAYDNWHPVWHTLLFFTLPFELTGSVYGIYIFQDIIFSLAVAHTVSVLRMYGGRWFARLAWCCMMLNPFVCYTAMFPWKDTPFALAAMTSATLALQIWCTRGEAGEKPLLWITLGISLANTALFRHNGILFSGFLLFALLFSVKKRSWWKTPAVFLIMMILVRGPLCSALGAKTASFRVIETTGLPLSVIGNVVKETPELLDPETEELADSIAPRELWESTFVRGNFNLIKWNGAKLGAVERAGWRKMIRMTLNCFRNSPGAAVDGLIDLTDLVYGVHTALVTSVLPYIDDPEGEIERDGNSELLAGLVTKYSDVFKKSPLCYLTNIGTSMLILLGVMLARCDLKDREDWKRILIALSVFCYNFGTMLLLTGPDARFFLETFLTCPVFVLLMLYKRDPVPVPAPAAENKEQGQAGAEAA